MSETGRYTVRLNGKIIEDVPIEEVFPRPLQMTFEDVAEMEQFDGNWKAPE